MQGPIFFKAVARSYILKACNRQKLEFIAWSYILKADNRQQKLEFFYVRSYILKACDIHEKLEFIMSLLQGHIKKLQLTISHLAVCLAHFFSRLRDLLYCSQTHTVSRMSSREQNAFC